MRRYLEEQVVASARLAGWRQIQCFYWGSKDSSAPVEQYGYAIKRTRLWLSMLYSWLGHHAFAILAGYWLPGMVDRLFGGLCTGQLISSKESCGRPSSILICPSGAKLENRYLQCSTFRGGWIYFMSSCCLLMSIRAYHLSLHIGSDIHWVTLYPILQDPHAPSGCSPNTSPLFNHII